ncbi:aldo/keto reductase [Pisciglobus halotolerans]|uniref:Aldo/keto reductase n=1 Tax=Pisciglobus halotolerans TaxID=745365 RepID=A0A1I3CYD1_9LACT|nr:aldo/keto reductase [Pisciglobus halotolerans]SFH79443.1 Aldo/keto reductase [Pisciglobus halotolerans]
MDKWESQDKESVALHLQDKAVTLPDGKTVPPIGQGTWYMGEDPQKEQAEIEALRFGLDLGLNVIDTAEMYGEGTAEELVGKALAGRREEAFLVSKVYPHHAGLEEIEKACENSLKRLRTDHLDLYLLHWKGSVPLEETIKGMEKLKKDGKILRWGVSNFDTSDMKQLTQLENGGNCATNQVLYHLGSRGIEYDLLPWQEKQQVPIMAYAPLGHGKQQLETFTQHTELKHIAAKQGVKPLQVVLAWAIRSGKVFAIPKASSKEHVYENAIAGTIDLDEEDLRLLDQAFPPPTAKQTLDII